MIPIRIAGTQPSQGFNYTNIFESQPTLQNITSNINPNKRRLLNQDEDGYEENRVTKTRKLKIYSLENKLDIIDYAKVIGNRAAGREFNVAESSIREWRKNESKIKDNYKKELLKNSESNELLRAREILSQQLDTQLIDFINAKNGKVTWYDIKYKAEELECQYKCVTQVDIIKTPINMGWVSRFMKRVTTKIPHVPPPSNSNHNLVHNNQNNNNNNNIQNGNVSQDINNGNQIPPSSILQLLNIHHQRVPLPTTTNNSNNIQNSQPFIIDQNVIATLVHQFNLQKQQQQQQQNCILNALLASQQTTPNKLSINYSPSSIFTLNNNNPTPGTTSTPSITTPTPTTNTMGNRNNNNNNNGIGNQVNPLHLQSLLQVENLNILQLINNLTNGKIGNFPYLGVSPTTNDTTSSSSSSSSATTTPSIVGGSNIISSSTPSPFDSPSIKHPLNSNNNNNILKSFLSQGRDISEIQRMILNTNVMISGTNNGSSNNNVDNTNDMICTKKSMLHNSRRKGYPPKKASSCNSSMKNGCMRSERLFDKQEHEEMIKQSDTEDSLGGCDSSGKTSDLDSVGSENRKMEVDGIENGNNDSNNSSNS
uniref:HTH CENPB-type domain-containing protein n=1 Tax=Strongyloides venezuelensis TaxID=75913 RepID=A0A0K0EZ12_STRVS